MPKKTIPLGTRFTRLVVVRDGPLSKWGTTTSVCKCDCGNEIQTINASLRNGHTKSCGCFHRDVACGDHPVNSIDLAGKNFGLWSVVSEVTPRHGAKRWVCMCKCGTCKNISSHELISGRSVHCGCNKRCSSWAEDLSGRTFNFLTVISRNLLVDNQGHVMWNCTCKCGNKTVVASYSLKSGNSKSCGCYRRETKWLPMFGMAARNKVLRMCKNSAKTRSLEFSISEEEFNNLISKPCHYCGTPPSNVATGGNGDCVYSGLDRVDNLKGYTADNVVPCCRQCNIAKGTLSLEEFIEWIKRAHGNIVKS